MKKNNIHQGPHKFQHLAKQAGMSLEAISEALTHSDTGTTQIYVNTSNVVPMTAGEIAFRSLKKQQGELGVNFSFLNKKDIQEKILEYL